MCVCGGVGDGVGVGGGVDVGGGGGGDVGDIGGGGWLVTAGSRLDSSAVDWRLSRHCLVVQ